LETQEVTSAGGVIFRDRNNSIEVALILNGNRWCLPKGLIELGETTREAALREVREETGLQGKVIKKIGQINYEFIRDKLYFKTVHFYLIRYIAGSTQNHDSEVDKANWFPIQKALELLAHFSERSILEKAAGLLA
jgi:8-oxo-dGTP pyrophosphatase MutT (NUDIX family)